MKLISQLISDILRVLQKLIKYFNDTVTSASFVLPAAGVFPVIFTLDLNEKLLPGELLIVPTPFKAGSSL